MLDHTIVHQVNRFHRADARIRRSSSKKSPRVADKFVQFLTLSMYQLELVSPHRPLIASRTTVVSIRALGGMFRASGLLLARSSKMVFIPSSNGYGRSGRILNW